MTDFPDIKVPRPDELDLEFFQAVAKAGALHIQRCNACSMEIYRPRMKALYYDSSKYNTYLEQLGIKYPTVKPATGDSSK